MDLLEMDLVGNKNAFIAEYIGEYDYSNLEFKTFIATYILDREKKINSSKENKPFANMIDDKKDIIDKLINNLYIHNSKLSKLYGEQYVKKLKKD